MGTNAGRGDETKARRARGIRVLVAVDLSDEAASAIGAACALARDSGEVHLVHVRRPPAVPDPLYAHYSPGRFPCDREREEACRDLARRLEALGAASAARAPVAVLRAHVVEDDNVASTVCRLAASLEADLVCVLARRKVAPGRCGRLVRQLLADCPKPVLVVRPQVPGPGSPDGAPSRR